MLVVGPTGTGTGRSGCMNGQGYSGDGGGGKSCWLRTIESSRLYMMAMDVKLNFNAEIQTKPALIYVACFIYSVHFAGQ